MKHFRHMVHGRKNVCFHPLKLFPVPGCLIHEFWSLGSLTHKINPNASQPQRKFDPLKLLFDPGKQTLMDFWPTTWVGQNSVGSVSTNLNLVKFQTLRGNCLHKTLTSLSLCFSNMHVLCSFSSFLVLLVSGLWWRCYAIFPVSV